MNTFELRDPVFHCDLPDVPLQIIGTVQKDDIIYYLIEKIGAPQHPCKLSLTSKSYYKKYWKTHTDKNEKLYKANP